MKVGPGCTGGTEFPNTVVCAVNAREGGQDTYSRFVVSFSVGVGVGSRSVESAVAIAVIDRCYCFADAFLIKKMFASFMDREYYRMIGRYAFYRRFGAVTVRTVLLYPRGAGERRNEADLRCTHISWGQCFVAWLGRGQSLYTNLLRERRFVFYENDLKKLTASREA